jgi:hypothetical protein
MYLGDNALLEGVRRFMSVDGVDALEPPILGRNVDVRHADGGGAHRRVVGDQSRVEVD